VKKDKLTPMMQKVLRDVAAGRGTHYGCFGRSEYGGRERDHTTEAGIALAAAAFPWVVGRLTTPLVPAA